MSKTSIIWAEVHSPIFMGGPSHGKGVNLGQKLDPAHRQGLVLEYDEEKRHLYVMFDNRTVRVPEPSILSMIEGKLEAPKAATPISPSPIKAQVSTPQDHVFAGKGAGKTGVAEALKKL